MARRSRRRTVAIASATGISGVAATAALWLGFQVNTPAAAGEPDTLNGGAPMVAAASDTASAPALPPPPVVGVVRIPRLPPGARVVVGGTRISRGLGEVPPGNHPWRVDAPGFFADSGSVSVLAGDTVALAPQLVEIPKGPLPTGTLRVRTVPANAEIFVNDRPLGVGAAWDSVLTIGTWTVRASAPGYITRDTVITIEEGKPTTFVFKMSESGGGS